MPRNNAKATRSSRISSSSSAAHGTRSSRPALPSAPRRQIERTRRPDSDSFAALLGSIIGSHVLGQNATTLPTRFNGATYLGTFVSFDSGPGMEDTHAHTSVPQFAVLPEVFPPPSPQVQNLAQEKERHVEWAERKRPSPEESKRVDMKDFVCPITLEVMRDPVFAADGFSYERDAIKRWFESGHSKSPVTNEELPNTNLVTNHTLRRILDDMKQN